MESLIQAVVIDDEADGRNMIALLLAQLFPDINMAGAAVSVRSGIELIRTVKPGLIFLDVEMPDGSGFDLLAACPGLRADIIMVTGHDHYALKAIKASVLDYLLKPVDKKEFTAAVVKALSRKPENMLADLPALLEAVSKQREIIRKVRIPTINGFLFVDPSDILRCEASGNYTRICFTNQKVIVASRTLGDYETELYHLGFIRIHHKHLINVKYIKEYNRGKNGGGYVLLHHENIPLEVSVRKKNMLLQFLEN